VKYEHIGSAAASRDPAKEPRLAKPEGRCEAAADLILQLNSALGDSFFGHASAPKLGSIGASRPASGSRSDASLP
jgi:hypothetical protein